MAAVLSLAGRRLRAAPGPAPAPAEAAAGSSDGRGGATGATASERNRFRELDDLVLELKGLLLVRDLRGERGAGPEELAMYGSRIDGVRERLARFAGDGTLPQVA